MTELETISVEPGAVLAFGGTNARFGIINEGDVTDFTSIATPEQPREFFGWMARQVLSASEKGNSWLVAGFPGPVDGRLVGPMKNVPGLAEAEYDLHEELAGADPAVGRLLHEGFNLLAVNDGEISAQAAADRIGQYGYVRTAALILGTGVGAGVVERDPEYKNVYRADNRNPLEIGHVPLSWDPVDTPENAVSGTALRKTYDVEPSELPASHPAWRKVAGQTGQMATWLGLMSGAQLVVPCGGVGANASDNYGPHLRDYIEAFKHGNATQNKFLPEIIPVPQSECQEFEIYGGEGVMRDFTTRKSET